MKQQNKKHHCPKTALIHRVEASVTGERLEPLLTNYAGCHHPFEAPIDADNSGLFFLNSFLKRI